METVVLVRKYPKGKAPKKVKKPSRPLDGINHRLVREQLSKTSEQIDNEPPTRAEIEMKARELGIHVHGNTSDKKLLNLIDEALKKRA